MPIMIGWLFLLLTASSLMADDSPERVLVVYNARFPDQDGDGMGDSEEVALYYLAKRNVPIQNLLGLQCSTETAYMLKDGWYYFFKELVIPIRKKLMELGEEQIYYILTCYGIPITYHQASGFKDRAVDNILDNLWNIGTPVKKKLPYDGWKHPYSEFSPSFPPDVGHFDHSFKLKGYNIYLTQRLSGASADYAKDLVDQALYAERYLFPAEGYYSGTLYIDTQFKAYSDEELQGYPFGYKGYESADKSIAYAKFWANVSGYPWKWENTSTGLEIGDPGAMYHNGESADFAPQALLYAGWYNHTKYNDVWTWLPGSAACDLNSVSLVGIRDKEPNQFIPNAFLRGLTCGVGVVYEPLISGHQRPEVLFYHLLNGFNFAESQALSNPKIGFVNMAVGDPLYNPSKKGKLPEQDLTPPPVPHLRLSPFQKNRIELEATIDTWGLEPDVVLASMEYGPTTSYGFTVPYGTVFRMGHALSMTSLEPSNFYHFRVHVKDPMGNITTTPDYICFTRNPSPIILGIKAHPQEVAINTPFNLDIFLSSLGGIKRLNSVAITLTAVHLGIHDRDISWVFSELPFRIENDPEWSLVRLDSCWPGFHQKGDYLFSITALHPLGTYAKKSTTLKVR